MGLLKHVLFWPITGPSFLARFSLDKVQDAVREQLTDEQQVSEDQLALLMRLELGEITEEEYLEQEELLMQRRRDIRHWREQFGMATSGGPVQVRREETEEPEGVSENDAGTTEPTIDSAAEPKRGGIASPEGASVEFNLDWD